MKVGIIFLYASADANFTGDTALGIKCGLWGIQLASFGIGILCFKTFSGALTLCVTLTLLTFIIKFILVYGIPT